MRAKLVNESLDSEFEERMRKRREEDDNETRELDRQRREGEKENRKFKAQYVNTKPQSEEPRYTNIDFDNRYQKDEAGKLQLIDQKERRKQEKKETARKYIKNNTLLRVLPTPEGVEEIENWKDEDGEGFSGDNYVIRSMHGEADLVVYEDLGDKDIVNELKTSYQVANDIDYLLARPILYKNWLKLSLKRKIASFIEDRKKRTPKNPDVIGKHD